MNDQIGDILLAEVRGMREEMNQGFSELRQRATALETNAEPFFENDGGRDKITKDIDELKKAKWLVVGGAGVISIMAEYVAKKLGF